MHHRFVNRWLFIDVFRRAALAAKEAELEARQQSLAGVDAKIAGLAAKFDKSLALIEEDRRLVATYQRELEGALSWKHWRCAWEHGTLGA
jgi:hypothetical protein